MKRLLFLLTGFLLLAFSASAQIENPVTWIYTSKQISPQEYELIFKASIQKPWHLYSQDIPMAPPATTFKFDKDSAFTLEGKVVEKGDVIKEYDKNFRMELKFYNDSATFIQKVKLNAKGAVVKGAVTFMSCNDTQCLPPQDLDFSFTLGKMSTPEQAVISATKTDSGSSKITIGGNKKTLWGFFIIAFLGGLIGILTPCVFPMIPMTVSFFMKEGQSKAKSKLQALLYGLSIIIIYTFVGSVLAVIAGPNIANFLSTHWLPNLLFFSIFLLFALSFFGLFEITLPHWLVNKSDAGADRGGVIMGPIFMALTLVLVSFSCTGPIVGTILVESAGGAVIKPIVGMFGFSLAFALPFTLFAFFPSWLSGLPKSGGWLNAVKVVLGFLELALALKFLSIADQTYHWHLLNREVYLALWIVIFTLLGFYLLGKIRFAYDDDMLHVTVPRLMLAIITFSFVVYLIPGMFGAPLKALSGYLPPRTTMDFDLNAVIRQNVQEFSSGTATAATPTEICATPKYHDFLELPLGLQGYFDYDQAVACSKEQNKPIFIDFTGHGCVNCREMEANVWSDPKVLNILRKDYVILALYVDDKYKLPESEWIKSTYDGKLKKTLGAKDADFQITKFGVNAQPFYVLMDNDGNVLTQPTAYDLNPDHFVTFLKKGLKNFKDHKSLYNINNK